MASSTFTFMHQSPCRLGAARVLSLRPGRAGRLRVLRGRLWVTLGDGMAGDAAGDRLLAPGQALAVPRGARLVAEPWDAGGAAFAWEPAGSGVAAAWRDLLQSLAQAGRAAGRLVLAASGRACAPAPSVQA